MNKKILFILVFILLIIGYIFKIDKIIVIELTNFTTYLKSSYKNTSGNIQNNISKYFNQTKQIVSLKEQIEKNKQFELLYTISNKKLQELEKNTQKQKDYDIKYVEVLSYLHINDFTKVLLNTQMDIGENILGLSTIDGYSAGIVIKQDNNIVAYLNNNEKCNYAVFIGKDTIPGITSGINKDNLLIIKYIPKWHNIKKGDMVYTSGMDNIFPSGLKVGIIQSIKVNANTQTAFVKTNKDILQRKYFYILK